MVLLADRLAQPVDLDVAGLLGELARMDQHLAMAVERLEQRGREAARGAEPGAGRNIGHRGDFERVHVEPDQLERLAHDRMLELVDRADALELGIFHDQIVDEGLMHRDVDVLVDRRRDQEAALLAIVGRQVGAAAAERDAKRRAHDDHGRYFR